MRYLAAFLLLTAAFAACGGDNGEHGEPSQKVFAGTLSGTDCWSSLPVSAGVVYGVSFAGREEGDEVRLLDETGIEWRGEMTSSSSFTVTIPDGDERLRIVVPSMGADAAYFEATTTCISFRCCTTLSGQLSRSWP